MARTRLTNPKPIVELKFNPYQMAFLDARRARVCPGRCKAPDGKQLTWSIIESPFCPSCRVVGIRMFRRFFLRAGRRGGKTRIGGLSAIEEMTIPNTIGWCCAPSYPELEDYVIPAFFSQLPAEWFDHPLTDWSEERLHLRLPNGAECQFRSLDDPNRGAGPGLDWVWIDEGRKIQELAWQLLRPSLTERKGIAWVTSSPDWGEDWCHRRFFAPAEQGWPGYWAVHYVTKDNPIIDPREVEAARLEMPPELFRREYEASIEFPTGTIYGEQVDLCDADDLSMQTWIGEWPAIDPSRPSIAPLDPGADHPFAGLHIVATPQGLCVVAEYEERNALYSVHAAALKMMVGQSQPRWAIDKSQKQASIELMQYGINAQGAENDVDAGIQRVYAWMSSRRLKISRSKCPKLLKRLRAYRYADIIETVRGVPTPKPFKKDDDLPDALRYGVMTWPELPSRALDVDSAGGRNLAYLKPEHRREIEAAAADLKDENEGDLVRVTDDFTAVWTPEPDSGAAGGHFFQ